MPALRRHGFTLIEVLIAVALGSIVLAVAYAGLRAASGAFATGNRLSIENGMMRAGFASALDELDFWRGVDDPSTGRMPLRQVYTSNAYSGDHPLADGLGLPFTPMRQVFKDTAVLPGRFDGDAQKWASFPTNQAARWRGNFAECMDTDCRFGRYAIFFDLFDQLEIPVYDRDNVTLPAYGTVKPKETWWCREFRGIDSALGYYGLADYMPANTINAHYGRFWGPGAPPNGDWAQYTDAGGIPAEWLTGPWKGDWWADSNRTPMTRYRATLGDAWGLMAGNVPVADLGWMNWNNRSQTPILWHGTNGDVIASFIDHVGLRADLMPVRPAHWPDVTTTVLRYFSLGKFFNLCLVRVSDPVSGRAFQFSFNGFGTTLRGARQQRGRDGGWAADGQPTLDSP